MVIQDQEKKCMALSVQIFSLFLLTSIFEATVPAVVLSCQNTIRKWKFKAELNTGLSFVLPVVLYSYVIPNQHNQDNVSKKSG